MAAAYEILGDPESRALYNESGMAGLGPGSGGPGGMGDAADLFAQFFSGGATFFDLGGGGARRHKGQDTEVPYDVTLEDLYNGKSVKMNMEREIICSTCQGSGARGSTKPKECVHCEGKGWTFIQTQIAASRYGTARTKCTECSGQGSKLKEKDRCKKCKGEKTVEEKTRQEIFIEKGMPDGHRIVLAGAGDQQPGIPAGDVIFKLKTTHHESFERSGSNLLTNVKITLSEALLGFSRILIKHLDGRGIRVSSPPGRIIRPGDSIKLRGEGMPTHKHPDQKGDLFIVLDIEMPDSQWLQSVNKPALERLLPSKKPDMDPMPEIVDEIPYEEGDIVDFGEGDEDDWEDDDGDDYDNDNMEGEPECRPQ